MFSTYLSNTRDANFCFTFLFHAHISDVLLFDLLYTDLGIQELIDPFFLRNSYYSRYSKKSPLFVEPESLFSCLKKSTTGLYLELDESNPHPCTLFHQNQLFSVTILSTPRSSKFSSRCRFYDQCFVWIVKLPHA